MAKIIQITDVAQWRKLVQSGQYRDAGLYEIERKTVYAFTYPNGQRILKVKK
jgi:hypothetical protein